MTTQAHHTVATRARAAAARGASFIARLSREARPWLRRRQWTRENLEGLAGGVRRHPRRALAIAVTAAAVVVLLARAFGGRGDDLASAEVREGPFYVSVTEAGTLQALRSVTYASTIQSNQAKIVALAPEGKLVQKGDLLVLFDAAPFEEEIRKNQALLAQAEADVLKAREDLKLQAIQNQEELLAARLRVEKSDLEMKDVEEGKGRVKEEEAASAVANAERELQKAETALADLKPLLAEGFITRTELERAEQQVARSREELELARRRRDALVNFGRPLELSQARSDSQSSRETLRQLESAASYRTAQKQAGIAAAQSRILEAQARLELARQQLARCEVRAEVPGIVVYKEVFFGSEQRKPQVGDQVWANQPLIILPDISRMVVETKVRETDIHKVERNQKVSVRVDAYPDLRLTGAVTLVGTLAQEEKERRGAKYFSVTVQVNESEPRLRPGMTARVEIEVEARPKALFVPIEAVFERDGRSVVYLAARKPRPREVVLGPSNADFVVVEKGLSRGDRVLLRDPEAAAPDFSGAPGS
ncbi:MAG TPA: efflux RND transporter periplasmic adaptor subunit [Vicinamibacteria bacterium]|nr:efflux RND transporter periplasmic adaptor subunit [Vicinamibacteria bacterium]